MYVCTYICAVKLEAAIQTNNFKSETHKASLNIMYTAWWLKTLVSKELKQFDLTHEQYNVLRILRGKAPQQMCVKDIAGRMIEKNSNVPRIIDRLVAKKLVQRTTDAQDKRHTVMTLTDGGFQILELSTRAIDKGMEQHLQLAPEQAQQLNQLLEQVRLNEP